MQLAFFWYGGKGLVVARLILGALFIAHGWSKVKDLKATARNFEGMGFKPGSVWGTIVAFLEFFGGIGILLGLFVPYITFFLLLEFITIIIWKLSKKMPFVDGWEIDALTFALLLIFFTLYNGFYWI